MEPVEPRTHRATREAWLGQLLLPMAFFMLLTVTAVRQTGMNPWIGLMGLVGLAVIAVLDYALPMLRNWLLLDDRSIEGVINGRHINLYWTEVIAAWIHRRSRRIFLCLGTRERTVVIPMRFFDVEAIWTAVCDAVSPAALSEEALNHLPDFQKWRQSRAQAPDGTQAGTMAGEAGQEAVDDAGNSAARSTTAVADHWIIQVAAWTGITCFVLALLQAAAQGQVWRAVLFGGLAMLCGLVLLNWGLTEFSGVLVERFTLFGGWRVRWDCVQRVEVGLFGAVIVLVGDDCQLVIPGAGLWSGSGKRSAQAMLLEQLEKRGIPLERTLWATFKFSRGARIQK